MISHFDAFRLVYVVLRDLKGFKLFHANKLLVFRFHFFSASEARFYFQAKRKSLIKTCQIRKRKI